MKNKTLLMIGNAHIDPVWLWPWQEGYAEIKASFRSALDRMNEYEDFYFSASSSAFYEWVEESDPAMFEEIKQRVSEGRWQIAGGWWVEPDCTVPSGESFARHSLYGQGYFWEKFNKVATIGFNVDSFGHSNSLPQILSKSGIKNYVFLRPGPHEKDLPAGTFTWRAPDGSELCAFRIPIRYNSDPTEIREQVLKCAEGIAPDGIGMCFYGVGNHGGGPTKKNIESILSMNAEPDMPSLLMATTEEYFEELIARGEKLPVVEGDLYHHASGCYSANSEVKSLNRRAENRLLMAEKLSAASSFWTGSKYPLSAYTESWKNVLFNQFHDILTGTSLRSAYEDAKEAYGEALHTAAKGLNAAIQAVSWKIDIPFEEGVKPIVVFNPNAFAGKFPVEMESSLTTDNTLWSKQSMILLDEAGKEVPLQFVQAESTCFGRVRLCFVADLPSLGYRTYRLVSKESEKADKVAQNPWFELQIDEKTGYIKSLSRKSDGQEFFSAPAAVPVVIEDKSDTWSHGITVFNKQIGKFTAKEVKLVESGPVKTVTRVISHYGDSKIIQDFSVFAELDYIQVKTTIDWRQQHAMLKLAFPMKQATESAIWETPYGLSERPANAEEFPMQKFFEYGGISFLNDGKTSGAIEGNEAFLTVLRSPIFAHHDPTVPDEKLDYFYQDQGIQQFNYSLHPTSSIEKTLRRSRELNEPAIALFETFHKGPLPQVNSLAQVEAENIHLAAIKQAQNGNGDTILRLIETSGKPTKTKIKIMNQSIEANFVAHEIKSLRLPHQAKATEVDLLERPI